MKKKRKTDKYHHKQGAYDFFKKSQDVKPTADVFSISNQGDPDNSLVPIDGSNVNRLLLQWSAISKFEKRKGRSVIDLPFPNQASVFYWFDRTMYVPGFVPGNDVPASLNPATP